MAVGCRIFPRDAENVRRRNIHHNKIDNSKLRFGNIPTLQSSTYFFYISPVVSFFIGCGASVCLVGRVSYRPINRIDEERYVVRVNPENGMVTLRWRWIEREEHQGKFDQICAELAKNENSRKLHLSCSSRRSLHSPDEFASMCILRFPRIPRTYLISNSFYGVSRILFFNCEVVVSMVTLRL